MSFARILAALFFLAGCSGSGGFNEGFKIGKKDDKRENGNGNQKEEQLGKEAEHDGGSADQPVQITGTYLTCVEDSVEDTRATFGCRLADKNSGATVALNKLATSWVFDYEVGNNTSGSVTVREATTRSRHQVYFVFEASSRSALKALVKATRIMLDMVLRPGAGTGKVGPEIAGLISSFIPVGQSEITSATQDLADNVVNPQPPPGTGNDPVTNTSGGGTQQPVNPTGPTGPSPTPSPVVVGPPAKPEPKPEPSPGPGPVISTDPDRDPVVSFSTVYKAGGTMGLMASFDQEGLTDATFTGGGPVSATNVKLVGDGSVTYRLSAEVAVSVKKGDKTCTASGAIITGNMSMPLTCK